MVALGYPGAVGSDGPVAEPGNLGRGWVGFDFAAAFGRPVRIANDAAMQALGGYDGGRMLFLGLGTGLGSALVVDRVVIPLELGDLPIGPDEMLSDRLGKRGLDRLGEARLEGGRDRDGPRSPQGLRRRLRPDRRRQRRAARRPARGDPPRRQRRRLPRRLPPLGRAHRAARRRRPHYTWRVVR